LQIAHWCSSSFIRYFNIKIFHIDMSESKDLRNIGLKATLPRLKVLELFQTSAQRHMSAEDVYKLLLNENASIMIYDKQKQG